VHQDATAEEFVQNFEDGDVGSKAGIEEAELQLLFCYAALVLSWRAGSSAYWRPTRYEAMILKWA